MTEVFYGTSEWSDAQTEAVKKTAESQGYQIIERDKGLQITGENFPNFFKALHIALNEKPTHPVLETQPVAQEVADIVPVGFAQSNMELPTKGNVFNTFIHKIRNLSSRLTPQKSIVPPAPVAVKPYLK